MITLGKKNFLVLCLFLFTTLTLYAHSKESLIVKTHTLEKKDNNCTYNIQYPVLRIGKDSKYNKNHINIIRRILIDNFTRLDSYENEFECNKKEKNAPAFSLNGSFTIKFQNASILSLYSSFSSFTEGNAHPENVYKAYTFDLETGKEIPFEALFKKGENFLIPLHKFMSEGLLAEKKINEKEEFIAAKKSQYQYYLTAEGIHFINLFDIHAMQSIEANVSYDKMRKYLDTEKTLKFLK